MSDFTPGPLSVSFGTKWPFEILIINESGGVVYRESLPCHSSKDKNLEEALNCWNFKASEQEEYAVINHRAVADAYLKAAATDLLEALQNIAEYWNQDQNEAAMADACWHAIHTARTAIAKATGDRP